MQASLLSARQNVAERAQEFQKRSAGLTARSETHAQANSSYRFYNERTAGKGPRA